MRLGATLTLLLTGAIMSSTGATTSSSVGKGSIRCLFSDIDAGTLVHYYESEADAPGMPEVLSLPESATGRKARISIETLKLAAQVRASGARLVLVSGTRYSTFVNRLPFLPRADAYVIENGGRVFYPKKDVASVSAAAGSGDKGHTEANSGEGGGGGSGEPSCPDEKSAVGDPTLTAHAASALTEDLKWRETMESATGPASQDAIAPEDREGPLWDVYRAAVAEGFEVDTNTYYTMIRIKVKTGGKKRARENREGKGAEGPQEEQEGEEEERGGEAAMEKLLASLPSDLRVVTNFGLVDICPLRSGKHNAAAFLAREHFDIPLANCASMGDDDNDIALANSMGKGAFITTFSSESVEAAAKGNPEQFTVAKSEGVQASEEMLRLIVAACS
ncbi:unnamed protein product [Ectocarpus sp. 12 AP-2014]